MRYLLYKNIKVAYKSYGNPENTAVILLHGYLESMEIWSDISMALQNEFYVITPDLPGHGISGIYSSTHSMEEMAETVKLIMDHHHINQVHLTGHSMGGYVTLAFRDLYPDRLQSFTLFHSHCFADPEEKKINRERDIELIRSGKKELLVNTHISNVFAAKSFKKCYSEIVHTRNIAFRTPDNGIIAVLNGLKNRKDRCHLLKQGGVPGLLITGCNDILIPPAMNDNIMSFSKDMKRVDLKESGHMGLVEEKATTITELQDFFRHMDIKTNPSL